MTLVKRISTPQSAFPRLFDDFLTKDFFDWGFSNFSSEGTSLPKVNIIENNDTFGVEMAAPGMKKEDFHIELENDVLKISSQKNTEEETTEKDRYVRREFSYQSFQRTFHLPKNVVDLDKVEANYSDGVLRIRIPKKEEAKALPPRTISIK